MSLLDKIFSRNTLYYPGCLTRFALDEILDNYRTILKKLGIGFIELKDANCCGSPVLSAGYVKDFEKLKQKNLGVFKTHGIGKIITNCPACSQFFKKHYDIPVEHITQTIWKNFSKLNPKKLSGDISYHDPCHLGRKSNVYDEPRNILKALGFNVIEFNQCKSESLCCGAGGGLKSNNPELSNKIAKLRIEGCKTKKLITSCPMCYAQLKENSKKGLEVIELSQVLV